MNYWFTSDYHLGHGSIIKHCNRPFKDLEHMNKSIIRNHNQRVKPDDIIYYLGDFCFRNTPGGEEGEGAIHKAKFYLKQLNGRFVFIQGNHDKNNSLKTIQLAGLIHIGGHKIWMIHNPKDFNKQFRINFVGHVHENWKFKRQNGIDLINVGVDVWRFMPVTFNEIISEYTKWIKGGRKNDK